MSTTTVDGLDAIRSGSDGREEVSFLSVGEMVEHRLGCRVPGLGARELVLNRPLEAKGVAPPDVADKPVTQSPIADEAYGSVLVFRDPDNIQLGLFCPPGP